MTAEDHLSYQLQKLEHDIFVSLASEPGKSLTIRNYFIKNLTGIIDFTNVGRLGYKTERNLGSESFLELAPGTVARTEQGTLVSHCGVKRTSCAFELEGGSNGKIVSQL